MVHWSNAQEAPRGEVSDCERTVVAFKCIHHLASQSSGPQNPVYFSDPLITTAGPGIPQYGTCTGGAAGKTYVMPGSEFIEDGVIIGWEFNLEKVGDITLMVRSIKEYCLPLTP
jgi:hypothetical protein